MYDNRKPLRRSPPFRRTALAGALALALLDGAAQAKPVDPIGPPVKLNLGATEAVQSFDVALNNPGAGVALWQELSSDGRYATHFRRFDRYGQLAPPQTHAVTNTLIPTQVLKVFDNGEFAVASWEGNVVKIQIRDPQGAFLRSLQDIQCKTTPPPYDYGLRCAVAMDEEGDLVVVDEDSPHIVAQLHDAAGKVTKPWFPVDDDPDRPANESVTLPVDVAVDADGDFVVAWSGYLEPVMPYYYPPSGFAFFRRFDKAGQPQAEPSDPFAYSEYAPSVLAAVMDDDGDFLISWDVTARYCGEDIGWTIYRKDGAAVAESSSPCDFFQDSYKVAMDDDGHYVVLAPPAFYSMYENDSLNFSLYRGFSVTGLGRRTLAPYSDFNLPPPEGDLAMDGKGHFAAIWWQSSGGGEDSLGLFLQRFVGPPGESCSGAGATIVGTPGPDTLNGTNHDDVIHGRGDDDVIHGRGGNDAICGGKGNDRLYGDFGKDRLYGQLGFDELYGGDGNDYLNGGLDVDFADGGPGTDFCKAESAGNCP